MNPDYLFNLKETMIPEDPSYSKRPRWNVRVNSNSTVPGFPEHQKAVFNNLKQLQTEECPLGSF